MSKPLVPANSPAGIIQNLLGMVPAGASVTVTVPVAVDRNLQVSVGISNGRPQPQPEPPAKQPQLIDMGQDLRYPAQYWYQQPEAD